MVQQADSVQLENGGESLQQVAPAVRKEQLTPRVVLGWLRKDATPAQQDSMVRAHIKPSEITWSTRPDTLHLPGHTRGKSFRDVSLPQYYRESFFSRDSLFHPELRGGRQGVLGDPVPYTVAGDNFITLLLLLCFVLACIAYSQSHQFISNQIRRFFYVPRSGTTEVSETSSELRFQLFLVLQTCLIVGIGYFLYSRISLSDTFTIDQNLIIGIYAGMVAVYFLLKAALCSFVNWVFFDKKSNKRWLKSYLFLFSAEGELFFPVIMLMAYFGLTIDTVVIYAISVAGLVKILSFYKCYLIFFRRKGSFLQNILYFCALEMVPFSALLGGLVMMSHYLKINY